MQRAIETIACALLILLFVYTGVNKTLNQPVFKWALMQSPIIGDFGGLISIVLPAAEIVVGILISWKKTRRAGLWVSLVLLVSFTVYLLLIITVSEKLPCSCGGVIGSMSWEQHILFNLFFILLNIAALFGRTKNAEHSIHDIAS